MPRTRKQDPSISLNLSRCCHESLKACIENIWVFWGASLVVVVLGMASLSVLGGALYGGFLLMLLKTMNGEKPHFKEIFQQFHRFFPLFVALWFVIILTFTGTLLLVIPGIFLGTYCFYLMILAADRRVSFDEAFVESRKAVRSYGFWRHFLLCIVVLSIPAIGLWLRDRLGFFGIETVLLLPFAAGLQVSAYRQTLQAEEQRRLRREQEFDYMRDELETAHDMQMGLLPKGKLRIPGYEISGICIPANHVGGDYFAYRWLDKEQRRLSIVMADVSGKAMVAAVIAVRFNEMLRYELKHPLSPSEILFGLHNSLTGQVEDGTFITCCVATLDTESGIIDIANAGHCHPYHYSTETHMLTRLEINGFALGMPPQLIKANPYDTARFKMETGDVVMFYTDGVVDAENDRGEFYDEARIEGLFQDQEAKNPAEKIVSNTLLSVERFRGSTPQNDDIPIVVLKKQR